MSWKQWICRFRTEATVILIPRLIKYAHLNRRLPAKINLLEDPLGRMQGNQQRYVDERSEQRSKTTVRLFQYLCSGASWMVVQFKNYRFISIASCCIGFQGIGFHLIRNWSSFHVNNAVITVKKLPFDTQCISPFVFSSYRRVFNRFRSE